MIEIKTFGSGSSGNLHLIRDEYGSKILLECGFPIKKIKEHLDFDLNIDACLLSHCHMDHAKSANEIMKSGINLVCSEETAKVLSLSGHRVKIISKPIRVKKWLATPFPTNHDTPGSLGFIIETGNEKIIFATDTRSLPYRFDGMTHIIIECNFSEKTFVDSNKFIADRIKKTHMSLFECLKFLESNDLSKVREIHLIHLSDRNSNANYFKTEVQKLTGKTVVVS